MFAQRKTTCADTLSQYTCSVIYVVIWSQTTAPLLGREEPRLCALHNLAIQRNKGWATESWLGRKIPSLLLLHLVCNNLLIKVLTVKNAESAQWSCFMVTNQPCWPVLLCGSLLFVTLTHITVVLYNNKGPWPEWIKLTGWVKGFSK